MKTIHVVAAVICDGDRYFATQRGYGDWKDYWEFPGGKVEPGETPEEALRREIREEFDTEIAVGDRITTVEYDYPAFHLSMECFYARVKEGELTLKEHEDAKWLHKDELASVGWLPADRTVVEMLDGTREPDGGPAEMGAGSEKTIRYYDANAEAFVAGTENADMRVCRDRFLRYLQPGQRILDAGCGSGRDTIAFRKAGYETDAFDASAEICRLASERTGIRVRQCRFEELEGEAQYDGIWACASLLHVQASALPDVLLRLRRLLKPGGVLYASFKYGRAERISGDRYFHDMEETACRAFLEAAGLTALETFVTGDVREGRGGEKWINAIARRES